MSFNLHTVILESFDFCLQFVGHNLALSDSFWHFFVKNLPISPSVTPASKNFFGI